MVETNTVTNGKKGVVAFDFDGVIGDSAYECYVQSLKSVKDMGLKLNHSALVEKQFRDARPLITKAEHYFTVLRMIEQNPKINFNFVTQAQMNAAFKADASSAQLFTEKFKFHRSEMQKISPKEWTALNKSFPRMAKFVRNTARRNEVYIATTKDKKSVVELLSRYGIHMPERNIIAVEFSKDKKVQLQEISRLSGKPLKSIVLVEDAVEQIKAARSIGAKAVLAPWGYSTLTQRKEARKSRYPIIKASKKDVRKISRISRKGLR